MPANLPPLYFDVEKKLKAATDPAEKVSIMEELLSIIPKHKGTEKLQAMYKTKIAKLKLQSGKKSGGKSGFSHNIRRSGAGQVILIGSPNSGRSSLIHSLTGADPPVGIAPYTTHSADPYMMPFENTQVQLVDTPPTTPEHMEYWIADLIKNADGVLFVIDLGDPMVLENLEALLEKFKEKRIEFVQENAGPHKPGQPFYKKTIMVANKCDHPDAEVAMELLNEMLENKYELFPVSSETLEGIEELRGNVFEMLKVIRVHSKAPHKKAELDSPFTLKRGSTVMDFAKEVHKDFAEKLNFARIWNETKYQGQRVNRDYLLEDEDIIELHM